MKGNLLEVRNRRKSTAEMIKEVSLENSISNNWPMCLISLLVAAVIVIATCYKCANIRERSICEAQKLSAELRLECDGKLSYYRGEWLSNECLRIENEFEVKRKDFYTDLTNRLVQTPIAVDERLRCLMNDHDLFPIELNCSYSYKRLGLDQFCVFKKENDDNTYVALNFRNVVDDIVIKVEIFDSNCICVGSVIRKLNAKSDRRAKLLGKALLWVWCTKSLKANPRTDGLGDQIATAAARSLVSAAKPDGFELVTEVKNEAEGNSVGVTGCEEHKFVSALFTGTPAYCRINVRRSGE